MTGTVIHFAFGLTIGFLLILILIPTKSKWLLYSPFIMTIFGLWASVPNIIGSLTGIHFENHLFSNIFFLNPLIDSYLKQFGFEFATIVVIYNLTAIGYLIHILKK